MKVAPPTPTTEQLHATYPLTEEEIRRVEEHRTLFVSGMEGITPVLVAAAGQCSTTKRDAQTTLAEGSVTRDLILDASNIFALKRVNNWKPRSNPNDWHGLETEDPELAYQLLVETVRAGAAACTELAVVMHALRYAQTLTMGWVGARNRDESEIVAISDADPLLPVLIKNDLDGSHDWAQGMVEALRQKERNSYLLYRGGSQFSTPAQWENAVLHILEQADGRVMLDLAHGSEQAHDPEGRFQKSVEAQLRALEHYIEMGERTGLWAHGVMLEASDAPSDTDLNMPHQVAIKGLRDIVRAMYYPIIKTPHW